MTDRLSRSHRAESPSWCRRVDAFENQLANHLNKCGMGSDCGRANHIQTELATQPHRFCVQIVDDFHVVRNETNGSDDHVVAACCLQFPQSFADIRAKPWLCR